LKAKLLQRAEGERQQRGTSLRLGQAGGFAEGARRFGKERHLRARRQHRRRVVERAIAAAREERRHSQPRRELGEIGSRSRLAPRDPGGEPVKAVAIRSGEWPEGVQRARPRALPPRCGERRQAERSGEVGDELAGPDLQPIADLRNRLIGDGEQDDVDVAEWRRQKPAPPLPRCQHAYAGLRQRLEQRPCHRAAAEHCGRPNHPLRNSTPDLPAHASSVSPLVTRPARISSARGDSTNRWITWRIGLAPSASWYPPEAIR
jgi:hypothetical protein